MVIVHLLRDKHIPEQMHVNTAVTNQIIFNFLGGKGHPIAKSCPTTKEGIL